MLFPAAIRRPLAPIQGADMNATHLVLCAGLYTGLLTAVGSALLPQEQQEKEKKKADNPVTRFFDETGERLTRELEGAWTLTDYSDPTDLEFDDLASGFATFHDGFVTLILAMDTLDRNFLGVTRHLVLDTGVFRYRIDEQVSLQLSSVMSFSNQNEDGDMERERPGRTAEYYASIEDDVLELRDPEGVVFSFRKVTAGEFPESAIRKLDRRRSGTEQWELEDEPR